MCICAVNVMLVLMMMMTTTTTTTTVRLLLLLNNMNKMSNMLNRRNINYFPLNNNCYYA